MRTTLKAIAAVSTLTLATPAFAEDAAPTHVTPPLYRELARATANAPVHADLRTVPSPVLGAPEEPAVAHAEGTTLASAR